MKSFTFTTLACLLLSAAQVEALNTEVDSMVDAQLEHKHVSKSVTKIGRRPMPPLVFRRMQ